MLRLSPFLKDAFEKFEQDFLASNLPKGKYIKPPASTAKYFMWDNLASKTSFRISNSDFAKICISPKPSGAPVAKVPLHIKKKRNLSNNLDKSSPLSTSLLLCQDFCMQHCSEKGPSQCQVCLQEDQNQILD